MKLTKPTITNHHLDDQVEDDIQLKELPQVPTQRQQPSPSSTADSTVLQQQQDVVYIENGVHYYDDGHYWTEMEFKNESYDEDYYSNEIVPKEPRKVHFSNQPIKVNLMELFI